MLLLDFLLLLLAVAALMRWTETVDIMVVVIMQSVCSLKIMVGIKIKK